MALNALRGGSSDLPRISVAHAAWNDQLYVPNKAHILTDWLLTRLLKERQNTITENPVLDPQYWLLLADILDSQSSSKKHWLLPLLNRVPVAPIFTTLLQLSASVDDHVLFAAAHRCFLRLWPLAVPKISAEALLETYGAFLRVPCCDHDLQQIGLAVIAALQYSVGNTSNRKKIFTLFIQHHLPDWISLVNEPTSSEALQRAYTVGVDVLFNVESLRQPYDEQHSLVVALHALPPDVVHPLLPRLFSAFVTCTRKHRNTLFGQGSTNSSPAITHNIRSAAFTFFHSCQSLLASQKTSCVWLVRCRLLEVIRDEHLFDSGNHDAQMGLQSILPLVVLVLTGEYNEDDVSSAMSCLSRLMEVDHDLILKDVPRILAALVPVPEPLAAIEEFLEILLNYHVKTRTIQTHLETLFSSLAARPSAPPSADIVHQYHVCASGALLQTSHLARLSNAIETFLTPSQLVPTADFILGNLRASWDLIASAKEVDSRLVLTFSLGVRLASTALTSLPIRSLSQTDAQTAQEVVGRIRDDFLAPALSKSLKTTKKQSGGQAEPQLISCALAHMAYSMDIHHTPKLWEKAQALLKDRVVISDLSIALFRLLLKWAHQAGIESAEVLFDHILIRLGQDETNLLFMLVERWLPTIDALASRQQLRRFITSLLDIQLDGSNETSLLLSALSSADFWELGNIRAAVLGLVEERSEMAASLAIYRLLRLFPVEYLSRSVRNDLVRRAMDADMQSTSDNPFIHDLRAFLCSVTSYLGSADEPSVDYLTHLVRDELPTTEERTATTMSLIGFYLPALLKTPKNDAVIDLFRESNPRKMLESAVQSVTMAHLIQTILDEFSVTQLSPKLVEELARLRKELSDSLSASMTTADPPEHLLKLWLHVGRLGRWLRTNDDRHPLIGRQLCSSIVESSQKDPQRAAAAFAILTHELHSVQPQHRLSHLGFVLGAYVALSRGFDATTLDPVVARTCSELDTRDFSSLLNIVGECFSDAATEDIPYLVRFASVLVSNHPPNTLKITQRFSTICLGLFAGRAEFTSGSVGLRVQVVRFLRQHCSESPASLRTLDMGNIWLLLSKLLANSEQHDPTTSTEIFIEIVSVVGALIRLRRDLVALTLPHLSLILQQIVSTVRRPRSQLGGKQAVLVADSLPRWINPSSPVSIEEARSISRLLEGLTTKTTVRLHSEVTQKAESLARPFSKHGAYVLKAYIDAMNDPLCFLPSDIRKDLRPGLFALCSIINEHNRDALMVSALDAGGKTILKNLWADYEKQKYVGKG